MGSEGREGRRRRGRLGLKGGGEEVAFEQPILNVYHFQKWYTISKMVYIQTQPPPLQGLPAGLCSLLEPSAVLELPSSGLRDLFKSCSRAIVKAKQREGTAKRDGKSGWRRPSTHRGGSRTNVGHYLVSPPREPAAMKAIYVVPQQQQYIAFSPRAVSYTFLCPPSFYFLFLCFSFLKHYLSLTALQFCKTPCLGN